jgi:ParB family chromosome partitioning protein
MSKLFGARQGEQVISGLKLIRHDQIEVRPQPRTAFPTTEVAELAASISELQERGEGIEGTGILQPLLVTLIPGNGTTPYRLIAGERRYRASLKAEIPQVPCLVLTIGDDGVLPVQLIENMQRQNLPPLDEARAFGQLQDEHGLSIRDIAKSLSKTRGYVTNRLDLLRMGADVQSMVSSREDTLKHAALIQGVSDPDLRRDLIRAVISDAASVKEIERRIEAAGGATEVAGGAGQGDRQRKSSGVSSREDTSGEETSSDENSDKETSGGDDPGIHASGPSVAPIPQPSPSESKPDPVTSSLEPAAAAIAEATRQLKGMEPDAAYRRRLLRAVKTLRSRLDGLEKAL